MKNKLSSKASEHIFLNHLKEFHSSNGTPFRSISRLNGKKVNLYELYQVVTKLGGWEVVDSNEDWDLVLCCVKRKKPSCLNIDVAIKQIYLRYLSDYEAAFFRPRARSQFEDYTKKEKKEVFPKKYNHQQHRITENARAAYGLSEDVLIPSRYEKLALSLISPLPNEQDFAINTVSLMQNLVIVEDPRILHYLLSHAGVYANPSLAELFDKYYRVDRLHCLNSFWENDFDDEKVGFDHLDILKSNFPLFPRKYSFSCDELVLERVKQVGKIVSNLSFNLCNRHFMARDEATFKFIVRCCYSQSNALNNIGWDLLTKLTVEMQPNILNIDIIVLLCTSVIQRGLLSRMPDAFQVLTSVLKNNFYIETVYRFVSQDFLHRVFELFKTRDAIIVMRILDFLLQFSFEARFCDSLLDVKYSIEKLVTILKIEMSTDDSCWGSLKYVNLENEGSTKVTNVEVATLNEIKSIPVLFCEDKQFIDLDASMKMLGVYLCEWRGCLRQFKTDWCLRRHVRTHCTEPPKLRCLWWNCDVVEKNTISLIFHVFRTHCVNRHMIPTNKKLEKVHITEPNPATNSVRISTAAILKNIATSSPSALKRLEPFESNILEFTTSNCEYSKIGCEILSLLR